ncbi:MAG TPA: tetratricopeptide repeat protein [Thermoanaerobaculia bacterium]
MPRERSSASSAKGSSASYHQHPNVPLEAWELYLRGRQLAYGESRRCLESAREMFVRAIELEPRFALAWSGIADALAELYLFHVREESFRRGADEAASRAVALDPALAAAHVSRAQAHVLRGEHEPAMTEFETAIALDARSFDAHHLFARFLWTLGHGEAAVLHLERAAAIRPDAYEAAMALTQLYFALGRESDRHNAALRTNALTRKRLEVRPDDVRALCMSAEALYVLGDRDAAMRQIERAYAIDPHDVCTLYNSACVFALDGQLDRGAAAIEGAVAGGFTYREWLSNDPDLALLRGHPDFQKMIGALPALGGD